MRKGGIHINGNKISQARNNKLMTQREIADMAGVTRVLISQMETKPDRRFAPSKVRKISETLGLSIDEVVKDK